MAVVLNANQIKAINELSSGKILLAKVGTGKSRTALAYYYLNECHGSLRINNVGMFKKPKTPKDLYIITTAKKRDNLEWEGEMTQFSLSTDPKKCVSGMKVVVDSWNNIKKYTDISGAFFLFDEDKVGGYGSWSKCFIKIARHNTWIICTATPGDDYMQYLAVFIANGFYRNKSDFQRQHCIFNQWTKWPKVERYIGLGKLRKERDSILVKMDPVKETVANNIDIPVFYDRGMYQLVLRKRWNPYDKEPITNVSQLCYLLRRVVNSDKSRLDATEDIIRKFDKVIIFYNYNYELDALEQLCQKVGRTYSQWNGHKHENIPTSKSWVYLCNFSACAEGWNCIETNVMVFYSQNYSYKTTIQAAGRIDRLNTPFDRLYYFYLKSRAPIDIAISQCLKRKKDFNENTFVKF